MDSTAVLVGLIGSYFICISASDPVQYSADRGQNKGYSQHDGYGKGYTDQPKGGRYYYGGKYTGNCGPDGLYFRDEYSFVLCSNAKGYVQPCAPGTRNTGLGNYEPGYYYGYSDFCNVNLVDFGYAAPKYGPGYARKPSFGFAAYRYPDDSGYGQASASRETAGYSYGNDRDYGKTSYRQDGYGGKQHRRYDGYNTRKAEPQQSYGKGDNYQTRTVYGKDSGFKY